MYGKVLSAPSPRCQCTDLVEGRASLLTRAERRIEVILRERSSAGFAGSVSGRTARRKYQRECVVKDTKLAFDSRVDESKLN